MLTARGQRNVERRRCRTRIIEKQLKKVNYIFCKLKKNRIFATLLEKSILSRN